MQKTFQRSLRLGGHSGLEEQTPGIFHRTAAQGSLHSSRELLDYPIHGSSPVTMAEQKHWVWGGDAVESQCSACWRYGNEATIVNTRAMPIGAMWVGTPLRPQNSSATSVQPSWESFKHKTPAHERYQVYWIQQSHGVRASRGLGSPESGTQNQRRYFFSIIS